MTSTVSISVDLLLIGRCLLALFWGILWAVFLQYNRAGRFWAEERTWLTVVIGVGVDGIISFAGDWWTCAAVIAFSSFGIILRSLLNETKRPLTLGAYKTVWVLEDGIALTRDITAELRDILKTGELSGPLNASLSSILSHAHAANELLRAARRGEYEQRRPER